jgi:hypothetical protein
MKDIFVIMNDKNQFYTKDGNWEDESTKQKEFRSVFDAANEIKAKNLDSTLVMQYLPAFYQKLDFESYLKKKNETTK